MSVKSTSVKLKKKQKLTKNSDIKYKIIQTLE